MDVRSDPETLVANLLRAVGARAAGLWRVEGESLIQAAFAACPELPEPVAREFATATRSVSLTEVSLGIVAAARGRTTCVSRAAELAPEAGSGRWLRAFGAARSIAVPIVEGGVVVAVLSVALPSDHEDDGVVADQVRAAGRSLGP